MKKAQNLKIEKWGHNYQRWKIEQYKLLLQDVKLLAGSVVAASRCRVARWRIANWRLTVHIGIRMGWFTVALLSVSIALLSIRISCRRISCRWISCRVTLRGCRWLLAIGCR